MTYFNEYVTIRWLTADEGGRTAPPTFANGRDYRPTIVSPSDPSYPEGHRRSVLIYPFDEETYGLQFLGS